MNLPHGVDAVQEKMEIAVLLQAVQTLFAPDNAGHHVCTATS
jgi:hypothetical protein